MKGNVPDLVSLLEVIDHVDPEIVSGDRDVVFAGWSGASWDPQYSSSARKEPLAICENTSYI
jgi:hypothetical protein